MIMSLNVQYISTSLMKYCRRLGYVVNEVQGKTWNNSAFVTIVCRRSYSVEEKTQRNTNDKGPLSGVRVLDLTRIVAGPFCTMTLSDLGAEVLKIEMPGTGDEARKWGPPFKGPESCYFLSLNRNKKSVCVNLKLESGKRIIYDLAKHSDVLIENYVPGKLSEMNLGYEHLKEIAPHLIYCSITGYGSVGPYRSRPGYDVIAASMGGLLHITGPQDGEPCKVGVAMTDIATGLYAHGAIMAALLQRQKTGKGQKIDCNLLSTQVAMLINIGANYLNGGGKEAKRWGTAHESIVPYESFPTADGYLTVGTGSDQQFKGLCSKLGVPHLASNEKFLTNIKRVENRKELVNILRSTFKQKTTAEWLKALEGSVFPYGPINTMEQVFNDEHIKAIDLVKEVQHPTAGNVKVVGPPVVYSEASNCVRSHPPLLGQHTVEILSNVLRYDQEFITQLKDEGAIQCLK